MGCFFWVVVMGCFFWVVVMGCFWVVFFLSGGVGWFGFGLVVGLGDVILVAGLVFMGLAVPAVVRWGWYLCICVQKKNLA